MEQGGKPIPPMAQKLAALGYFKDWSNYLLVTTVAALGWAAKDNVIKPDRILISHFSIRSACLYVFALSILFGIFTLALLPHVEEQVKEDSPSIYEVQASVKTPWKKSYRIKSFCLPQHVFFLMGIILFVWGAK